jgi:hypothetical protein
LAIVASMSAALVLVVLYAWPGDTVPGVEGPTKPGRDAIQVVTSIFGALVAPLALLVAWRSSQLSRAAFRAQIVPLLVDAPRELARQHGVTAGGTWTADAGSLQIAVRGAGNGAAVLTSAELEAGAAAPLAVSADRLVIAKDDVAVLTGCASTNAERQRLRAIIDTRSEVCFVVSYTAIDGADARTTRLTARPGTGGLDDPLELVGIRQVTA